MEFTVRLVSIFAMLVLTLAGAQAADRTGGIEVKNAWVRATIGGGAVSAGYATLADGSGRGDVLLGIDVVKGGRAMIHETYVTDEIVRMRLRDKLDVPANGKVDMSPGGIHIMLVNLPAPLKAGDVFPLKLRFARQGEMSVDFQIR
jgi:copper(I)-binding protein